MDIKSFMLIAEIVEQGTMSGAAEILGYTQSAASHMLTSIENELGFPIFTRKHTGMELNENGKMLIPLIYDLLSNNKQIFQVASQIKGVSRGKILIGSISHITVDWLAEVVGDFCTYFPGVEIDITDGSYRSLKSNLLEGRIDCAFLSSNEAVDFDFMPLVQDHMYAVFPKTMNYVNGSTVSSMMLAEEHFISPSVGTVEDIQHMLPLFIPRWGSFKNTVSDATAFSLIKSGRGFSILPGAFLRTNNTDSVIVKRIDDCIPHSLGMATKKGRYRSPSLSQFRKYIREWINQNQSRLNYQNSFLPYPTVT